MNSIEKQIKAVKNAIEKHLAAETENKLRNAYSLIHVDLEQISRDIEELPKDNALRKEDEPDGIVG